MLYMQHFMSKFSAKNVFIIIKTCSDCGAPPPDPRFRGGGLCTTNPTRGSASGPRWETSVPQTPNYPPAFQFPRIVGV